MVNFRVRLLKEHAGKLVGAVLRLPREECLRLHRLGIGVCLEKPDEVVETQPTVNYYAQISKPAEPVLPAAFEQAKDAPPVSVSRGRGRKPKN